MYARLCITAVWVNNVCVCVAYVSPITHQFHVFVSVCLLLLTPHPLLSPSPLAYSISFSDLFSINNLCDILWYIVVGRYFSLSPHYCCYLMQSLVRTRQHQHFDYDRQTHIYIVITKRGLRGHSQDFRCDRSTNNNSKQMREKNVSMCTVHSNGQKLWISISET